MSQMKLERQGYCGAQTRVAKRQEMDSKAFQVKGQIIVLDP